MDGRPRLMTPRTIVLATKKGTADGSAVPSEGIAAPRRFTAREAARAVQNRWRMPTPMLLPLLWLVILSFITTA